MKPTSHVRYLQCFGLMFEDKYGKNYYTGDTNDVNYVIELSKNNSIKTIY